MTYDELRLRGSQVLLKLAPPPVRASGLEVFEAMPAPVTVGKVMLAGPGCHDVSVGDIVLFEPEALANAIDGFPTPHLLVDERNIACIAERTA